MYYTANESQTCLLFRSESNVERNHPKWLITPYTSALHTHLLYILVTTSLVHFCLTTCDLKRSR